MRQEKEVKVRYLSVLTYNVTKALLDIAYGESETGRRQELRAGAEDNATPSSYWSVPEQDTFYNLVRYFGTDWQAIAATMKTKTAIMVCKPAFSSKEMCTKMSFSSKIFITGKFEKATRAGNWKSMLSELPL